MFKHQLCSLWAAISKCVVVKALSNWQLAAEVCRHGAGSYCVRLCRVPKPAKRQPSGWKSRKRPHPAEITPEVARLVVCSAAYNPKETCVNIFSSAAFGGWTLIRNIQLSRLLSNGHIVLSALQLTTIPCSRCVAQTALAFHHYSAILDTLHHTSVPSL